MACLLAVSCELATPPPPPSGLRPVARLQLPSTLSAGTLLLRYPSARDTTPRSHPSVTLCRRIALPRWPMSTPWVRFVMFCLVHLVLVRCGFPYFLIV